MSDPGRNAVGPSARCIDDEKTQQFSHHASFWCRGLTIEFRHNIQPFKVSKPANARPFDVFVSKEKKEEDDGLVWSARHSDLSRYLDEVERHLHQNKLLQHQQPTFRGS